MAKGSSVAGHPSRKQEQRMSGDKVTKSGESNRCTAPPADTSVDDSSWDTFITREATDSHVKHKKKEKKEKMGKEGKEDKGETDSYIKNEGAMLFTIDTTATPIDLATVEVAELEEEPSGADLNQLHPSGLNRFTRRRIKRIESQREKFSKKVARYDTSEEEKRELVQDKLNQWLADLEHKDEERNYKKKCRREKHMARLRTKRGKLLTGRDLKEKEKRVTAAEKKANKKKEAPV
ncbi:hypothetical protein F4808DRAFT_462184 [Astrocystis sublimbata]|nr:hypothetical protein F4808DRAFT_462184 [Astrocystis sublimbata]